MNILITGNISSLSNSLANRFSRENHKIIIAAKNVEVVPTDISGVSAHAIDPTELFYSRVLSSYKFDAVVFLADREEMADHLTTQKSGYMLDSLLNVLNFCKEEQIQRFFLISSTEIYGGAKNTKESAVPEPTSINGYALKTAEEYCELFRQNHQINTTIVRVPHIFGPLEKNTLLYQIIRSAQTNKKADLPCHEKRKISLLHADDVADFLLTALDEPYQSELQIVNLSGADVITLDKLVSQLQSNGLEVSVQCSEDQEIFTAPVESTRARDTLNWVAKRTLDSEINTLIQAYTKQPEKKTSLWNSLSQKLSSLEKIVKWIELILGAALVQWLNSLTGTLLQFKYVDFRLLFVILMGSMHGTLFGLLASILASASALFSWYQMGLDWELLMYNIENWLPFAIYFTAGAITGYIHDQNENRIRFKDEQVRLIQEKYEFLYSVYDEIRELKDRFRDQLMGYHDSFGRIYEIATELDSLQEEDVLVRALGILEDVLENNNIAIYAIDPQQKYARLQVNSQPLNNMVDISQNLSNLPIIIDQIKEKKIFQNTELLPDYPSYFVPIINKGSAIAAIEIWNVKFEQFSLYYLNLIKVITGLIQSSLVRATLFKDANIDRIYLSDSKILTPESFKQILNIKNQMREDEIADYEMLQVEGNVKDHVALGKKIDKVIRDVDYVGQLEDGKYTILLSQANQINSINVIKRLSKSGVTTRLITAQE